LLLAGSRSAALPLPCRGRCRLRRRFDSCRRTACASPWRPPRPARR